MGLGSWHCATATDGAARVMPKAKSSAIARFDYVAGYGEGHALSYDFKKVIISPAVRRGLESCESWALSSALAAASLTSAASSAPLAPEVFAARLRARVTAST